MRRADTPMDRMPEPEEPPMSQRPGTDRRPRRLLVAAIVAAAVALGLLPSVNVGAAAAATCPCSVFAPTQTPSVVADPDTAAVELGMKFRADQAGYITGVRFYKSSTNTGTHTGSLWSSTGTRLATVTFGPETASGW